MADKLLRFLSVLALCMSTCIMLDVSPFFFSFLAAAGLLWLTNKFLSEYSRQFNRSSLLFAGAFSLLFGQACGIGGKIVFKGFRCDMYHNYLIIDPACIFTGVLVAIVIFPAVLFAIGFASSRNLLHIAHPESSRKVFFISWATITAFWLPYLLTYAPGGIVGDGVKTLEEVLRGGPPSTNHWSVAYILVLRFFLFLGSFVSDNLQAGIYLWVIFATVSIAAVFALVAATLWKKGAPLWLVAATVAMYALCGFFASYGMSLWKDGTFGAGVVLLSLMLWKFSDTGKTIGKRDVFLFILLGLFLCTWRSNGPFLLALSLICMAILSRKRAKPLLVAGTLVIVLFFVLTGPIYRACGIGSDSLRESISIPTQQLAAVINHDRPLTDAQKEILFDILPEETWRQYYFPGISDDLKANMSNARISSQLPGMLRVWAQLLPHNFKLYVETYLMQTIGFWKPFSWRGLYFDFWVGVLDFHHRGYRNNDYVRWLTGDSIKPILNGNMRFISSGTMVWLLLFACTAILCRHDGRAKRLLPLVPLLAGWAAIMISTPMAFFYRYVVFLPMALPIIAVLPFGTAKKLCGSAATQNRVGNSFSSRSSLWGIAMLLASLAALLIAVSLKSDKIEKLGDAPFDIFFSGRKYNADRYVVGGIGQPDKEFSWASGNRMDVIIPAKGKCKDFDVRITVAEPFNGHQRWIARQNGSVVGQGLLESAGYVVFPASVERGDLAFSIELPDAQRPCDVYPDSKDNRLISLPIKQIRIGPRKSEDGLAESSP